MRYFEDKGCGAQQGQKIITACQTMVSSKELTVTIVGESACNDPILRVDCTLYLRSPILARLTLVLQGLVDGTWKYVYIVLQ